MDSLLIVLVVIGVVMILAGVARMRSKRRRYGWDDIDHSVLFSKTEHDTDAATISAAGLDAGMAAHDARREPDLGGELQNLNRFDADDQGSDGVSKARVVGSNIHENNNPRSTTEAKSQMNPANRARSILNKLRRETPAVDKTAEESISQKKGYKTNAPDKVIVLNVMAPPGQHFVGPKLIEAIESSGLRYGDMQIFHYYSDTVPVFGVVNMVKPGVFDLDTIDQLSTPGVSLFVQMPNDLASGLQAFDTMLSTAQQLAECLGGELRDETRSVLTHSAIDHIRQQVAEYDCKWLASA